MRRIFTTLFGAIAVVIVLSMVTQAQNVGAPWMFTAFGVLMIIVIAISVIRAWLRR